MPTNVVTKGKFTAGTLADFFFTFADIGGTLFDPSDISLTILDFDGNEVETFDSIEKLSLGYYVLVWSIPSTTTPGLYSIDVEYTVEESGGPVVNSFSESFVIGEQQTSFFLPQSLAYRTLLESQIGYAQRIPVFDETGRLNRDRTVAHFSFPRWNQPCGARVIINGDIMEESAYEVDYLKGKIHFNSTLSSADEIHAKYNFRWFTDDELDIFILEAIQIFNQYAPHSAYQIFNLPPRYGITIAEQAAVFCLRRLIMDFTFQEPRKVIGPDRAQEILSMWDTLKRNYEEELKLLYMEKKKQPYTGLMATITTPAYTLPGGRSRWFRLLFSGST